MLQYGLETQAEQDFLSSCPVYVLFYFTQQAGQVEDSRHHKVLNVCVLLRSYYMAYKDSRRSLVTASYFWIGTGIFVR